MFRLPVRIAALAFAAGTLGGCGMMGGDASSPAPAHTADVSPMAPDVESNVRQVQELRLKGDTAGATRIISQLMLVYPDDARVVGEYGKLLVQIHASTDAVQFLRRAIQLQPNDWTLYSALGVAFDQQSNAADARIAYEQALTLKPGEPAVLNNYAMSRLQAGDTAGARTLLLAAKASGSTDPRIASNLALLDRTAPPPALAAPAMAVAAAPRKPVTHADMPAAVAASPAMPKPVAKAAMPPVVVVPSTATGAPKPLMQGNAQVVMQAVPFDPLAGPVAKKPVPTKPRMADRKPAPKPVASAPPAPKKVAATETKAKPVKKAADHIPALRMTADAGKP